MGSKLLACGIFTTKQMNIKPRSPKQPLKLSKPIPGRGGKAVVNSGPDVTLSYHLLLGAVTVNRIFG